MALQASCAAMNFSRNSQLLTSAKQPSQTSNELYVHCALEQTEHTYTSHAYSTRRGTYTEMKGAHPRHSPVLSFFFCHHTRKISISTSGRRESSKLSSMKSTKCLAPSTAYLHWHTHHCLDTSTDKKLIRSQICLSLVKTPVPERYFYLVTGGAYI